MRKNVKLMAVVLAFVVAASVFTGCGKVEKESNAQTGKLTFWGVMDANSTKNVSNYSEMLLFKKMKEATGIDVEFIHPVAGSTGNEAFITMLSTSDFPDIIEYGWNGYNGGPQAAIDDGVIVALNDYIEEYAPNYYDYLEGEKGKEKDYLYKYQITTNEGNYFGFNALSIGTSRIFSGLFVRADLLEKWGLNVPETIDDWTGVFAKAKSEGIKYPATFYSDAFTTKYYSTTFQTGFGVGAAFYVKDGKVVFGPFEKGYKEFVAQLGEWMKAGYINPGFITNKGDDVIGEILHGSSIATMGGIGGMMGSIIPAGQTVDPNFDLVACPWPVPKTGDTPKYLPMSGEAGDFANAISTNCDDIETAMRWCDYFYSEEGNILKTFGVEGDTYTIEERDGETHYVYTDKIHDIEAAGASSVSETLYKYFLPANHSGLNQHPDYLDGYYPHQAQKDALRIWNEHNAEAVGNLLPNLQFTDEENKKKTDILTVAFDPLEVAIHDIILGKASIDTYDAAIEKAKKDGYTELLELYQTAYERYLSKFN